MRQAAQADHVDDAVAGVAHRQQRDAVPAAVLGQPHQLIARHGLNLVQRDRRGGRAVVHGRERAAGTAHGKPASRQFRKGLRRRHLVQQMQVDEP
jgi:hypothetical protein